MKKNILLLRFSAMGDVALLAPVLFSFTQRYPEVAITLVTRPKFAVFFAQFPTVKVVSVDLGNAYKGVRGLLRLFAELRQLASFDAVIDVHQNLRSSVLKSLFRLIGVPSVTINKGRTEKNALTRRENKVRRPLLHSVERYAHTFDRAGYRLLPTQTFQFAPFTTGEDELNAFLDQQRIQADTPWLGIAPFAQHPQKMWPFDRFVPLLDQLTAGPPITIFLFGGGSQEIALLDRLHEQFPQTIVVAGRLSLAADLALIRRLTGMLCMDSGNMHLAALSGVPVLSIWGATHTDAGFGPWGPAPSLIAETPIAELACRPCSVFGSTPCWRGDLACLRLITVETIAKRVNELVGL